MNIKPAINGSIFRGLYLFSDSFYLEVSQPKKKFGGFQTNNDGTPRERKVAKPIYELKRQQRELNNFLQVFNLPGCMHGGLPGKNNISNALQHIDNTFFLTIDLKNFFGTITNSRVQQTLIGEGLNWDESRRITRITTFKGCLPQGAPTSTVLANLCFAATALALEKFCRERNITFTVFVDDLTFSSPRNFRHYNDQILKILHDDRFFVNQKKVHYRKDCCEITGLIVKKGKISLPGEMPNNMDKPGIKRYAAAVEKQYNAYMNTKVK